MCGRDGRRRDSNASRSGCSRPTTQNVFDEFDETSKPSYDVAPQSFRPVVRLSPACHPVTMKLASGEMHSNLRYGIRPLLYSVLRGCLSKRNVGDAVSESAYVTAVRRIMSRDQSPSATEQ
jgi:hypothetical protein